MSGPGGREVSIDAAAIRALASATVGGGLTYDGFKRSLRDAVAKDPFDATVVTVLGGAFLFYLAEKGQNPKVTTYWDALVFVSTCLSVGYADIFARTPAGQAIASALMTLGPAMSGAMLEVPAAEGRKDEASDRVLEVQKIIADKLDAILGELRAQRGA